MVVLKVPSGGVEGDHVRNEVRDTAGARSDGNNASGVHGREAQSFAPPQEAKVLQRIAAADPSGTVKVVRCSEVIHHDGENCPVRQPIYAISFRRSSACLTRRSQRGACRAGRILLSRHDVAARSEKHAAASRGMILPKLYESVLQRFQSTVRSQLNQASREPPAVVASPRAFSPCDVTAGGLSWRLSPSLFSFRPRSLPLARSC